jgi:hypothetical protein
MFARQCFVLAALIGSTLISAETPSASNPNPIGIFFASTISVADEIGKTTSQPSLSLDVEQNCGLSKTSLNHLHASTRAQICNELTEMRENLQRIQTGIDSFRESIITSQERCDQMDLLAVESAKRLHGVREELLDLEIEHEMLKTFA